MGGKKKRAAAPARLAWHASTTLTCNVVRRGRLLSVGVSEGSGKWLVLAVESGARGDAQAVLEDHAHAIVGEYPDPATAATAAERYAVSWAAAARPAAKTEKTTCPCGPI